MTHPHALWSDKHIKQQGEEKLEEIPECPSDKGAIDYWNLNKYAYHVENISKTWSVCARLKYTMTERGSIQEYKRILFNGGIRVWLYSGDFDDVVPFTDTEKNVE
eukprot:TRINITY_DN12016_c0_g2_i1.p1 TRINITY_DN12016_c0_g2~~TRINITY_DN12016_c0_g2_i1.p1  ORF type:complete len:105 (+),score=2.72 TRINITY_DN12016_c0_g2_i1:657-971(+)